jgi:hypothetical protein
MNTSRWLYGVAVGCLMAGALATGVRAEEVPDGWRQQMEAKIDALTQEVEKSKLGAVTVSTYTSVYGLAPSASKVYHVNRGVSLGGYGELLLQAPDHERDDGAASGRKRTLDLMRAVLYAGYKFNDKVLFNSEIEFEHATTGEGDEERGEVSVEFAYLDYLATRPLGLRAGLLLVPMGFINETHEPTTFHGARRPSVETTILPSTWRENGAGVFGEAGPFSYRAYVLAGLQGVSADNADGFSAGSAIRGGRSNGTTSSIEDLAWVGRVDYVGLPGVMVGASGYTGKAGQNDVTSGGAEIDAPVSLWETHAGAQWRGLELRTLYSQGTIGDVSELNDANALTGTASIGERFFGGYAEVAFDLLSLTASKQYLAPFVRYERYDTQQHVPGGFTKNPANSRVEYTMGLTYKPIPNTVLKADWQNIENQAGTGVNQFNLALGYAF